MLSSLLVSALAATLLALLFSPYLFGYFAKAIGSHVRSKTESRRNLLFDRAQKEEAELVEPRQPEYSTSSQAAPAVDVDHEWEGVVGFFHPFW